MGKIKKSNSVDWVTIVSQQLKELRKGAGYTSYEDFALQHEFDRKQYWRIENGANITLKTLVKILEKHNKDLPSFFKEIELQKKK